MSEHKDKTVLVVDDSPADLHLTLNVIKERYKVLAAKSGAQALALIPKASVDIVLLDVNMPDMDGYETCKEIKALENPPAVIFISANDSTDEITKGYEVGGEDYLVKPYSSAILTNKIESTLKLTEHIGSLIQNANQASSVAMTAMSSSGELSIVIDALRESFATSSITDLGKLAIATLGQYGLVGSVQIRHEEDKFNFTSSLEVSPLEAELLNRIAFMEERMMLKGARFFINYGTISMLIKNMPIDNEDLTGRLRDYLAIVAEGINEKSLALATAINAHTQRNQTVTKLVEEAEVSLTYALDTQQQLKQGNLDVLHQLEENIQAAFISLGLSEVQEQEISELIEGAEQKSAKLFEQSMQVSQELQSVVEKFNQLKD